MNEAVRKRLIAALAHACPFDRGYELTRLRNSLVGVERAAVDDMVQLLQLRSQRARAMSLDRVEFVRPRKEET